MKNNNLTIHFMPFSEIESKSSSERIKKILGIVLQGKIVILQGRLKAEEETRLIEDTMALIGHVKGFQGVELATISSRKEETMLEKFRYNVAKVLVGEQDAVSIIGPANLVKEIKKDPKKIELMLKGKK